MNENFDEKKLKETHNAIEDALRGHLETLEIEGFITGWIVGVAIAHVDDDSEYDGLYSTQSDGLSKWASIGIATTLLDSAKELGTSDED